MFTNEKLVIKIIKQSLPAVVSITITEHLKNIEKEIPREILPFIPKNKKGKLQIPKALRPHKNENHYMSGSGFIVDSNGLILTNKHIVSYDKNTEYTVIKNDGKKYKAEILSRDPINDVAILKINASNLKTLPLGDSSKLELGQTVLTIGNALGVFENTVSLGIISGLSRSIYTNEKNMPPQELRGLIQTDAAINPGNSGGPLINLKGEVIGINSAMVSQAENIGFAIPINAARRDLEDIKKYGKIRRPFLGIHYLTLNDILKEKLNLPFNYGVLITKETKHDEAVIPQSPAYTAGLKENDIILECNGKQINEKYSVLDILEEKQVDDILEFLIWRNNKKFKIKVKLSERNK